MKDMLAHNYQTYKSEPGSSYLVYGLHVDAIVTISDVSYMAMAEFLGSNAIGGVLNY